MFHTKTSNTEINDQLHSRWIIIRRWKNSRTSSKQRDQYRPAWLWSWYNTCRKLFAQYWLRREKYFHCNSCCNISISSEFLVPSTNLTWDCLTCHYVVKQKEILFKRSLKICVLSFFHLPLSPDHREKTLLWFAFMSLTLLEISPHLCWHTYVSEEEGSKGKGYLGERGRFGIYRGEGSVWGAIQAHYPSLAYGYSSDNKIIGLLGLGEWGLVVCLVIIHVMVMKTNNR